MYLLTRWQYFCDFILFFFSQLHAGEKQNCDRVCEENVLIAEFARSIIQPAKDPTKQPTNRPNDQRRFQQQNERCVQQGYRLHGSKHTYT